MKPVGLYCFAHKSFGNAVLYGLRIRYCAICYTVRETDYIFNSLYLHGVSAVVFFGLRLTISQLTHRNGQNLHGYVITHIPWTPWD